MCGKLPVIEGPLLCNHPRNNIFIKSRDISHRFNRDNAYTKTNQSNLQEALVL